MSLCPKRSSGSSKGKGRAAGTYLPRQRDRHKIASLVMDEGAVAHLDALALHHRDPFDRMLIAQALAHDLAIVSNERAFDRYGVRRLW